jgi:hypothetical protein
VVDDVDDLMDMAISAVEDTFGRTVSYLPVGGSLVDVVGDAVIAPDDGLDSPGVATPGNHLDCREATLETAGITPRAGDRVSFPVRGVTRTYEVTELRYPAHGSVHLVLGRRTA